ncbi:uncharacterized protein LOC110689521 [Chenopodium quinoa]|uniref:uncharacterized protein LOC110689521 n=1 Tax=Chenopodium quinoa TaxID=63459 RepID=UPI000B799A31|nr:uncharacterized protein LOC110689521 [Chenopodium quinoa]
MKWVDKHGKYLGIPTIIGRYKRMVFEALKDGIWKKLNGWKEKLLSRVGKEVLLKSVIQAIPTYLMGVYKFPAGIINDIHSMMARFLWGNNDGSRRISMAIGCFLDANLGWSSSFSWRSIWSSKSLIKEGLLWRIGDGTNVKICQDPWLVNGDSRFMTSPPFDEVQRVSDLIVGD